MIVELHILQNFAPANLNRDDTGSPKDCDFGGHRRARISSQCLKRAMRRTLADEELVPAAERAVRTKRLVEAIGQALAAGGQDEDDARRVAASALAGLGLKVDEEGKTQYLVYLGSRAVEALAEVCRTHWEVLLAVAPTAQAAGDETVKKKGKEKKDAKDAVPKAVKDELLKALDAGRAADLALFGRMLADLPDRNVDAACQVAHAISTNRLGQEFDYYTAVDDLKPGDTSGADMIGTVEFNSSCFYRYANLDVTALEKNLGGDRTLSAAALEAFVRSTIRAIPTGKQNSMAAHNPPSFVFAVVRERGPWNLANAFLAPIRSGERDLASTSATALDRYWGSLVEMYGDRGIRKTFVATLDKGALTHLSPAAVAGVDALVAGVLEAGR